MGLIITFAAVLALLIGALPCWPWVAFRALKSPAERPQTLDSAGFPAAPPLSFTNPKD